MLAIMKNYDIKIAQHAKLYPDSRWLTPSPKVFKDNLKR
jgi:hypothetical protein